MVYSIFYYATEAITRAVVSLILKALERRKPSVERKAPEVEILYSASAWGFARVSSYGLVAEYRFVPRATRLSISIPELVPLNIEHRRIEAQPERLFFTFTEAASKDWFKTIEWLAEQLEKKSSSKE